MYMRFLQLKIDTQYIDKFKMFYEETVYPRLQNMPGCLFACLIKSGVENNEFISLTFWDSLAQAENYEKNGAFRSLIEQSRPFLSESTEWKIHLSENIELQYAPVSEEPVIKKYSVKAQQNNDENLNVSSTNMFVRIVSVKVQENKLEEFKKIYTEEIIPELKSVKGCRNAYLIESINDEDEYISLTVWDNKENAENYEASGKFSALVGKIKHTFSQFYLWKMALEKDYHAKVQTTEDLKIEHYNLVTGKSFT
jgi:heme-degrading monooxygenase HmoA